MARYRMTPPERALSTVSRAVDLAWGHIGNDFFAQRERGAPLDGRLPDLSFEGAQRRAAMGAKILELLDTVDDDTLPHDWALSSKLVRYYANSWSKDAEHYWVAIDPTCSLFYGPFAQTAYTGGYLFSSINPTVAGFAFGKDGDGERYLTLLADITRMLWQIHERTAGQAQRGIRIHQPQLPAVRTLLQRLRSTAQAVYPVAAERLATLKDAGALAAEIARRVEQGVLPAFDALISQLDAEYERLAPAEVGMDQLPGGRQAYAWLLRQHTTREFSAEQVHAAGHARMARIQAEMAALREQLGFTGSAADFADYLRRQPGAVATSADDIGERMRRHKDGIEQRFDEFFHQRSAYAYDLVRLDPALEGSMTWGFYHPPVPEEPRGLYHYNGGKLDSLAVIAAASLVFHELVPGHHLHLTLQRDNEALLPLRRNASVNAFNEAWAEYSATLTGEMGLYDDPHDRYGRLCMDAFLTCRLVVDTGMNALGWSWERAKDYLREHTLCAEAEIESDTLRYSCGIPAQSLAYKLGDEDLLRMRENVRARMKERFDYRDFHAAILDAGALPLPALEWHLDRVFPGA
ncbi:MAG TPA: DUF885 domain-containing protein [Solimonas sp.]